MVKKLNKRLIAVCVLIGVLLAGSLGIHMYLKDYYEATATAQEAIAGDSKVSVDFKLIETKTHKTRYYVMTPQEEGQEIKGGVIFYPGGLVEEEAYAPLLRQITLQGYQVFIVRMPVYLAIFGQNRADDIMENYPDITSWTMMGHSLGGAVASMYTAKNTDKVNNLILLAAYSTKDLTDSGVRVLQLYGTEDQVINRKNLEKNAKNLPEDAIVYEIEGGNHSNFGYYGDQKGDGQATITREEQIQVVMDEFQLMGL